MDTNKSVELVKLSEYCETHGIDGKRARRLARIGKFPGASKTLGVWAIDKNAPVPTLPVAGTRGTSRTDGRKRYIVYANTNERDTIIKMFGVGNEHCVIDPREQTTMPMDKTQT